MSGMGSIVTISEFKTVSWTELYVSRKLYIRSIFEHFYPVRTVDGAKYAVLVSARIQVPEFNSVSVPPQASALPLFCLSLPSQCPQFSLKRGAGYHILSLPTLLLCSLQGNKLYGYSFSTVELFNNLQSTVDKLFQYHLYIITTILC